MAQATDVVVGRAGKKTISERWATGVANMKRERWAYAFSAPFIILFFVFFVLPVLASIVIAFTYYNLMSPPQWIGWTNFRILFLDDDVFLIAVKNTLLLAFITGPVGYIASFIVAWMINQMRGRLFYTIAFYAPSVSNGIAMTVIWKYFFSGSRYGLLNFWLIRLGFLHEPYQFLKNPHATMWVVVGVSIWASLGAGFLVLLAGLQNVNEELYEAGKIDGIRNRWQQLWYITMPLLKPQMLFAAVMQVVAAFEAGAVAQALIGFPSPLYSTRTIILHMNDYAFLRYELGYATAIAMVLFVLMFGLSRLFMRIFKTDY